MNDDGTITDEGTIKTQKGYDSYKAEGVKKQKDLEARDEKAKDAGKRMMEFGSELLKRPVKAPEKPTKMAKGGTASSRADGCAQRGKTRGKVY